MKQDPTAEPKEETAETEQGQRESDTPKSSILPFNQSCQPVTEIPETGTPKTKTDKIEKRGIPWPAIQTISQIFLGVATVAILIYHGIVFSGQEAAMEEALKKTDKQLGIANRAVDEAEKSRIDAQKAMIIGTQPYIGIEIGDNSFNPGELAFAELKISNEGNTPTTVNGETKFVFTKGEIPKVDYVGAVPFKSVTILQHRPPKIVPIRSRNIVSSEQWEAVGGGGTEKNTMRLFLYGRIWYTGVGGPYPPKEFFFCYPGGSVGDHYVDDCREDRRSK